MVESVRATQVRSILSQVVMVDLGKSRKESLPVGSSVGRLYETYDPITVLLICHEVTGGTANVVAHFLHSVLPVRYQLTICY